MFKLNKSYYIILIFFLFGCQSNKLYDSLKNDFAHEKEAKIYNKTSIANKISIPLNGMIIVKENETIYTQLFPQFLYGDLQQLLDAPMKIRWLRVPLLLIDLVANW